MRIQSAHELAEARAHEDEIEVERVAVKGILSRILNVEKFCY